MPPPHGLMRGNRARSSSSTRLPQPVRLMAAVEPAGPPPTTMASYFTRTWPEIISFGKGSSIQPFRFRNGYFFSCLMKFKKGSKISVAGYSSDEGLDEFARGSKDHQIGIRAGNNGTFLICYSQPASRI